MDKIVKLAAERQAEVADEMQTIEKEQQQVRMERAQVRVQVLGALKNFSSMVGSRVVSAGSSLIDVIRPKAKTEQSRAELRQKITDFNQRREEQNLNPEQTKLLRDLKYGDETDELKKADGKEEAQGHEEEGKDVDDSSGTVVRGAGKRPPKGYDENDDNEEDDDLDKVDFAQVELESRKHMQLAPHEKSFALTDAQNKPTKSKPKRKQDSKKKGKSKR